MVCALTSCTGFQFFSVQSRDIKFLYDSSYSESCRNSVTRSAKKALNNFLAFLEDLFNVRSRIKNRLDRPFDFEDTLPRASTILNYDGSENCTLSLNAQLPLKIVYVSIYLLQLIVFSHEFAANLLVPFLEQT